RNLSGWCGAKSPALRAQSERILRLHYDQPHRIRPRHRRERRPRIQNSTAPPANNGRLHQAVQGRQTRVLRGYERYSGSNREGEGNQGLEQTKKDSADRLDEPAVEGPGGGRTVTLGGSPHSTPTD